MPSRSYTAGTQFRYGFNGQENDNDVKGIGNQQDYGMRIYDTRIGKFLSVDPLLMNYPQISNYNYSQNSPIYKLDIAGEWDITVHAYSDRSKYGYGIAIVTDRNGKEVYRFNVRLEGVGGRDRLKKDSDTPLGIYDIPNGNEKWITGKSRKSYGPYPRLSLNGLSGEILESGRSLIRIHGGRQETAIKNKKGEIIGWEAVQNPELKKTHGCLRAFDEDVNKLKQITTELESKDKLENGGKLTIIDDLVLDSDGQATIPSESNSRKSKLKNSAKDNFETDGALKETNLNFFEKIKNFFRNSELFQIGNDDLRDGQRGQFSENNKLKK